MRRIEAGRRTSPLGRLRETPQKVRGAARPSSRGGRRLPEHQPYEHGTLPHVDFLITLAAKENVSIDWLLLGKGTRELR
jgi:hypothetical protein